MSYAVHNVVDHESIHIKTEFYLTSSLLRQTNCSEHDKTHKVLVTFIFIVWSRFETRSLHDKFDELSKFHFLMHSENTFQGPPLCISTFLSCITLIIPSSSSFPSQLKVLSSEMDLAESRLIR
jgi:hypothetical protein